MYLKRRTLNGVVVDVVVVFIFIAVFQVLKSVFSFSLVSIDRSLCV